MFRTTTNSVLKEYKTEKRKLANHRICKVDQFSAQPFNRNEFGWSRNSIGAMAHAQSYAEYIAIAQAIQKNPIQYGIPKGTSLARAFSMVRPRMCQSPSELEAYAQQLAELDMEELDKAYHKAIREQFDAEVESVDQSADVSTK